MWDMQSGFAIGGTGFVSIGEHSLCPRIGRIDFVELVWTRLGCRGQVACRSSEFKFRRLEEKQPQEVDMLVSTGPLVLFVDILTIGRRPREENLKYRSCAY